MKSIEAELTPRMAEELIGCWREQPPQSIEVGIIRQALVGDLKKKDGKLTATELNEVLAQMSGDIGVKMGV